ncbi:esterase family protein, partial [candidate division WOR-3 bacterium]|nr:esterase family protein [candidate division WOR-3 bacterium]
KYDWFIKLPGTKILYKTFEFPIDASLDYQFVIGNEWILDPYNPDTIMSGFGPKSEVNMPGYIEANEIEFDPNITHGQIIADSIYSEILGETRVFKIYTPASFNYNRKYPSLYIHDGYEFISIARLENVLDNMIYQRRIQPLIAILIHPVGRFEEYFGEKKYAEFIVEELVPYIDRKYPTIDDPDKRCTAGISAGGTISIALGWYFPEVFGCIISQSGVIYIDDEDNNYLKSFTEQPSKNLKLYVDVGIFEWLWMFETNRLFKSVLDENNYPNLYMEFNEWHSWGNWRSHIKYGLEYLLGN